VIAVASVGAGGALSAAGIGTGAGLADPEQLVIRVPRVLDQPGLDEAGQEPMPGAGRLRVVAWPDHGYVTAAWQAGPKRVRGVFATAELR
jgi:hypothetical protein